MDVFKAMGLAAQLTEAIVALVKALHVHAAALDNHRAVLEAQAPEPPRTT
jgi:hypothetical protein